MGFFNLGLRNLLESVILRKKRPLNKHIRSYVPLLEGLEERALLSFVVTVPSPAPTNFDGATITAAQNIAVSAPGDTPGDTIVYGATGLPSGLSINPSTGLITGLIADNADTASPGGTYMVNVTANDTTSNDLQSNSFIWQVNADPVALTVPTTQTNFDGATIIPASNLTAVATGPNNDTLTYTATGLPSNLTINPTTGSISGQIADNADSTAPVAPGMYTVVVTATDATANASASQSFTWQVNADPVALTAPATQTNFDGATITAASNVTAAATGPNNDTLTYSATGLPSNLTIDPNTGIISGQIADNADSASPFPLGMYTVVVTATDGMANASASQSFTWNVNPDLVAFTTLPGAQSNFDGATISAASNVTVVATDSATNPPDQTPVIAYSATGLPKNLTIDSTTGVISGTIAGNADTASPYTVDVTATDTANNSSVSQTFDWFVSNPITVTNPGTQANFDGATINLTVTAKDSVSGDTLSYSATGLPSNLTINPTTGVITGKIAGNADSAVTNGAYTVVVTVSGTTSGASTTQTFTWNISNPINVSSPGAQNNDDGATVKLQLTAVDSSSNALTYNVSGLPTGLTANTAGLITGTIADTADTSSPYTVTETVSDATAGANSTITFNWTVNPDPVSVMAITAPPYTEGATITNLPVVATDSQSGDTLTYSATGLPSGLTINSTTGVISGQLTGTAHTGSPYTVIATATDAAVNASDSQTFTWMINASAITFTTSPSNQTSNDGATITSVKSVAKDSSGHAVKYSATGLPSGLTINSTTGVISGKIAATADTGSPYSVVVTATDKTNATVFNIATFTWTVNNPVALGAVNNQSNFDSGTVSLQLSGTDSENNALTYSATGLPSGLTIAKSTGLITGTIAATDDTGGTAGVYTVTVKASDAKAPASASQTFTWTISANPVTITAPAAQTDDAGATITTAQNIQAVGKDTSTLGGTLAYSAKGLPSGLTINSTTGVISGTIAPTAHTGSPYTVTVTATDSTANASATSPSFTWTVNATPVSVTKIANQTNEDDETIKPLPVVAKDTISGSTLTYSATGLPSGLTIAPTTGIISGTIAVSADTSSPYTVTVTATDATANAGASQTFKWTVNPSRITGVVFFDANGATKYEAGDPVLPGVSVVLTGTTTQNTTINVTCVTNASGDFAFLNPPPGTYQVKVGTVKGLTGTPSIGDLASPLGVTVTNENVPVKSSANGGVGAGSLSLDLFLTNTTAAQYPYGPPGSGTVFVDNVTTTTALAAKTLTVGTPTTIDLAANFTAAAMGNSDITMNIDNGGTMEAVNLTLYDTVTPQTVANFYDYINSGEYNNSVFTRLVSNFVLQGGGANVTDTGANGTISSGGAGYTSAPTVTFSAPPSGGTTATGTAVIANGAVTGITMTNVGSGYTSAPTITLAGGGFTTAATAAASIVPSLKLIEAAPPTVPSEYSATRPNVAGTIAMAQSSGVNSATDEFFFNTVNNTSSLDPQSFTVFGKVDSVSTATLNTLAATPTENASSSAIASVLSGVGLDNLPLTGYTGGTTTGTPPNTTTTTSPSFPGGTDPLSINNLMTITGITINNQPDFLTYTVSSSNTAVATASLGTNHNEQLTLTPVASGTATITVTATDRFGLSKTVTFTVTVS